MLIRELQEIQDIIERNKELSELLRKIRYYGQINLHYDDQGVFQKINFNIFNKSDKNKKQWREKIINQE